MSDLQRIGEELVQMHGQSEQLLLRDTRTHAQMLDDYAGNGDLLKEYAVHWDEWNRIQAKIEETEKRAKDLAAQKDFLKFQFDELQKAALKDGEEEELEERVNAASKSEIERRYLNEIQAMLGNEKGILDQARVLQSKIRALASKLPQYEPQLQSFEETFDPFECCCKELLRLSPSRTMSEADIDKANARIALTAQRKEELECLENLDADLEELAKQATSAHAALECGAARLSESRAEAARRFDTAVEGFLRELGMPKASFKTSVTAQPLGATGADKIEFMLAPNPGEGEKSLQKAVSGGELSRVLLAIKSVMAELDRVPLLIFDEVDSGISGEVGNKIGEALSNLGRHHQVLTITHLHQVASRAQNQLAVSKKEEDGRTYTSVKELDYEGRVQELVRMLGGDSDAVREHARQLLEENK